MAWAGFQRAWDAIFERAYMQVGRRCGGGGVVCWQLRAVVVGVAMAAAVGVMLGAAVGVALAAAVCITRVRAAGTCQRLVGVMGGGRGVA